MLSVCLIQELMIFQFFIPVDSVSVNSSHINSSYQYIVYINLRWFGNLFVVSVYCAKWIEYYVWRYFASSRISPCKATVTVSIAIRAWGKQIHGIQLSVALQQIVWCVTVFYPIEDENWGGASCHPRLYWQTLSLSLLLIKCSKSRSCPPRKPGKALDRELSAPMGATPTFPKDW